MQVEILKSGIVRPILQIMQHRLICCSQHFEDCNCPVGAGAASNAVEVYISQCMLHLMYRATIPREIPSLSYTVPPCFDSLPVSMCHSFWNIDCNCVLVNSSCRIEEEVVLEAGDDECFDLLRHNRAQEMSCAVSSCFLTSTAYVMCHGL